jgi:hypothetical protein
MEKPKKPRKPKKHVDLPDKYHHFEKIPYEGNSQGGLRSEVFLADDDDMQEEGIRLIKFWAQRDASEGKSTYQEIYDEYMEEGCGPCWAFSETYCYFFDISLTQSMVDQINKALPENAECVVYHFCGSDYYAGSVTYKVLKTEEEYKAEVSKIDDRFNQYAQALVKYEEELEKYENWKREEKIKQLENEITKLKK